MDQFKLVKIKSFHINDLLKIPKACDFNNINFGDIFSINLSLQIEYVHFNARVQYQLIDLKSRHQDGVLVLSSNCITDNINTMIVPDMITHLYVNLDRNYWLQLLHELYN